MGMKLSNDNAFKFKKFSEKQLKVLTWWMDGSPYKDYTGIICDGSIRSGKTISMGLSFVTWATERFDGENFGICGRTVGSCRRNVITELKKIMRACKTNKFTFEDHRSENLLVIRGLCNETNTYHTNYFFIFGGKDEASQDLIQGITLAGVLLDEVALMPESFVNQATGRCSVDDSKIWFNCNPEGPFHWFKQQWINLSDTKNFLYLHFTMADNLSLGDKIKARFKSMYAGIFYQRFILGLWVLAQGVIYDMFDPKKHVKAGDDYFDYYDYKAVSIDYGTQNPCTFGLFGIKGMHVHEIKSYYYDGRTNNKQKTDRQYAEDLKEFIGHDEVKFIIVDPSASSFIAELMEPKYHLPDVMKARNAVLDGIRTVSKFLQMDLLTIDPSCEDDIREFGSYTWDIKASMSGTEKPVKEFDHAMDKIRYLIFTIFGEYMNVEYNKTVTNKGNKNPIRDVNRKNKNHIF